MRTNIVISCLALSVGCTDELPVSTTVQAILEPGGTFCPTFGCGNNTSIMDEIYLIDAHETGAEYNDTNFRILRFEQFLNGSWHRYRADVSGGQLYAIPLEAGLDILKGPSIEGARFTFYNQDNGRRYYLFVEDYGVMQMWSRSRDGGFGQTALYRLKWVDKGAWDAWEGSTTPPPPKVDICGANPDGSSMPNYFAVLYEDDRIDIDAIKVTAEMKDWFTIGCAGSALAKQHLLGHTKGAGLILGKKTTLRQRTANLKMITADYCGRGHPFTAPGMALEWKDAIKLYDTVQASQSQDIEAKWTENGAACLNEPRVDYQIRQDPNGDAHDAFPDGVSRFLDPQWQNGWCTAAIPMCEGTATAPLPAHITTVNTLSVEEQEL